VVRLANQNRFLSERGGVFYYCRRVPAAVSDTDERAPFVRQSLKTDDLARARAKRDILEKADNELWASMLAGEDSTMIRARFEAARLRAESLGFSYRPAEELAQQDISEIVARVLAIMDTRTPRPVEAAVLGGAGDSSVTVSAAFDVYCDEIVAQKISKKSPAQRNLWKRIKRRAIDSFIEVVEDKPLSDIDRDDARKFYLHWMKKISPKSGPRISASMGNRAIGDMRVLYSSYFTYIGQDDRTNPFANLGFSEDKKRKRPPFPKGWIEEKILAPGALAGMNEQERGVVLAMIETGARPSELCNLVPSLIRLDADVPHITIEPRDDPDDPREIKTHTSVRRIPLVGISLEVFKKHPNGFPRYKDREASLSTAIGKYMRVNKLFPTPKHKTYSIRHTFEDRMKEGNIDTELRKILMGHSIDRPEYGSGGALEWRREQLLKIALPFDPSIV